ncbi:MAG: NAD(+) diphosphatase [bacterium]|nr:NAD(+) diphosphatase [bacterium]
MKQTPDAYNFTDSNNRQLLNYFDAVPVDRMTEMRKNDKWLTEQLENPAMRIVPLWRDMNLIAGIDTGTPSVVFLTLEELRALDTGSEPEILLGMDKENNTAYFAVDLPENDATVKKTFSRLGTFQNLRHLRGWIDRNHGALLGYARAMAYWHRTHRFCGKCGTLTRNEEGGHLRVCTDETCRRLHFPRTDPAVIVLVNDGEHCLLGRSSKWRKGTYSTIAGFVEPGESLELAVAREVLEETGVHIDPARVVYHSSQPWPFPASIMLGFTAQTERQEIRIDPDELEHAAWFSRADIEEELKKGTFHLPSEYSIAYRLIDDWRQLERITYKFEKKVP